jgi:hypothetical protein
VDKYDDYYDWGKLGDEVKSINKQVTLLFLAAAFAVACIAFGIWSLIK